MAKPPNRKFIYQSLIHPNTYDVFTTTGNKLGATYKKGKVWTIAGPDGEAMTGEFPTRAEASEALWQAMEARYAASKAAEGSSLASPAPEGFTWYVDLPFNERDRLCVSLERPNGEAIGEFSVKWHVIGGDTVARLEAFSDGWKVLADSRFVDLLATWPEDIGRTDMARRLVALGYVDRRPEGSDR